MVDMEILKAYMNTAPGFNRHNGIEFTVVEEGYCECQVELTRQSLNPQGVAHGSLLFALCDCVTGVATASTGRGMLTQSATIHFLRPGSGQRLYARSKLLRNGKNTALCLGEVTDEKGRLLVTSQFEVFYTSDTLTLPTRNADGSWTASQEEGAWKA
jgi:uncharacterized protein (TIGR00369 family)